MLTGNVGNRTSFRIVDLGIIAWIVGSETHPFAENRDLGIFHAAGWRHFQVRIVVSNGLNEPAVVGLTRDNGGPTIAPLFPALPGIELQPTLDLLRL